jgi:hypothetical protein
MSTDFPYTGGGTLTCWLRGLLEQCHLDITTFVSLIGVADPGPLKSLYYSPYRPLLSYSYDLLARICAIFRGIPLDTLLEYRPLGEQSHRSLPQNEGAGAIAILPALPKDYGRVRCIIGEQRVPFGDYHALAIETNVSEDYLIALADGRMEEIDGDILLALCHRLVRLDCVLRYEPGS